MYGIDYVKLIAIGLVSAVLFLSGWFVNGWRWDSKYQALVNQYKEEVIKAEKEARSKEQKLQAAVDNERQIKDEEIRIIRSKLDASLYQLRQRSLRPTADSPGTSDFKGATGSQLYREDGEFLVREAARADEVRAGLKECYSSYDHIRSTINNR